MGFDRRDDRTLAVGDRYVRIAQAPGGARRAATGLVAADTDDGGRPLLNHLALLVDDAREIQDEAEGAGSRSTT